MNDKKNIEIEEIISNNLVKMTEELNRKDVKGIYTQFNNLAMETLFLILRKILVKDSKDIHYLKVRMSGIGFTKQQKETRDFLEKKSSIFALANKKDSDNLRVICKIFEEKKIIENIVNGYNIEHLFKAINLVEICDSTLFIINREYLEIDTFIKSISRNFVLSSLIILNLLYKLLEDKQEKAILEKLKKIKWSSIKTNDKKKFGLLYYQYHFNEFCKNSSKYMIDKLSNDTIKNHSISNQEMREFKLNRKTGILKNLPDETRNISFKVETFNNIIWTIKNEIKNKIEDENIANEIIFKAGYVPGLKFGKEFNEHTIVKKEIYEPQAIIKEWFDFDSKIGFGKFTLIGFSTTDILNSIIKKDKEVGEIKIEHNFLLENNKYGKINSFIEGYIEGVLNGIFIQNELFSNSKLSEKKVFFIVKEKIEEQADNTSIFDIYIENLEIDLASYIIARQDKYRLEKEKEINGKN